MKLNRVQKENIMLEERNKILSSQLENSVPTTPTEVLQVSATFCRASNQLAVQSCMVIQSAAKFSYRAHIPQK